MNIRQPNILVYSPNQAEEYANYIRKKGFSSVMVATTRDEAEKLLLGTEVILGWKFPTELLSSSAAATVKWYQSTGAGVDDLVADSSIPDLLILTRIVDQFGGYISEYVFTYLLYLVKDVARISQAQLEHRWDPFIADSLAGKTIGVAGMGSIGTEIVRKARAFEMKVFGLSKSGVNSEIVDKHFFSDQWPEFVKDLDYLVLTLPLTMSTYHIVNRELLLSMKPGAIIVNVGRGALMNENDLVTVLKTGHLGAAVLDVFETEPLPVEHPLYSIPNVYITPHLSGPSTADGVCDFFAENLNRYMAGQPLAGVVDWKRGY
ncbi:D-2-hydroxyacid dehydrogenase [Neobacillus sp. LXY-1]|uniref:D-2-hydroxyacid dehydrogenase n=1 Tax=Neobacillus sp. LXY-1 TaxID=3379133 RepID=UPI003EE2DCEC